LQENTGRELRVATILVAIPCLVALVAYLRSYFDLFEHPQQPPANWLWRGTQSILIAAFSPLIMAASKPNLPNADLQILLGTTAIVLLVFFMLSTILAWRDYSWTKVPIGFGRWQPGKRLTPARIICVFAVVVIILCAAATIYAGM
jgi:hypothetical protein